MKCKLLLKVFFIVFLGFVLLELSLQFLAVSTINSSFGQFLQSIPQRIAGVDVQKTIFCLGDSTMFGIGASNPELYSLPNQLEKLIQSVNPEIACLNLAYPVSSSEDHLQIMSFLPIGSTVLYRGGIADEWNREASFRFSVFNWHFEFRSLKMLVMKFGGLFPIYDKLRRERISQNFLRLSAQRQIEVFALDYTTYPSYRCPSPFYLSSGLQKINLRFLLSAGGFFRANGDYFADRFISMTGNHPNDLGYYAEALAIFNYFCQQRLFGLSAENTIQSDAVTDSAYISSLQKRYQSVRQELLSVSDSVQIKSFHSRSLVFHLLPELWSLAGLLHRLLPEVEYYQLEYQALERLAFLVFHDTRIMVIALSYLQQSFLTDQKRFLPVYYATKAVFPPDSLEWPAIRERFYSQAYQDHSPLITYLPLLGVYPLEFCPIFLRESNLSPELVTTAEDWSLFFSLPYQELFADVPAVCQ